MTNWAISLTHLILLTMRRYCLSFREINSAFQSNLIDFKSVWRLQYIVNFTANFYCLSLKPSCIHGNKYVLFTFINVIEVEKWIANYKYISFFTIQYASRCSCVYRNTVETLYNTVNFCWNTHKIHSIARPKGRGMGCLLWVQRATYCVDLSRLSSIKYLL